MITFDKVPGLFLLRDFFALAASESQVQNCMEYHRRLESGFLETENKSSTPIAFALDDHQASPSSSAEQFGHIQLLESSARKIVCDYFPRYGEDGHALAYFRKARNLPDFVLDSILPSVGKTVLENSRLLGLKDLPADERDLDWRLTFNFYSDVAGTIAGFPYHVDVPAYGNVTMILNVQRTVLFQITDGSEVVDIDLPVGGLLLLSGASRFQWKHRVVPTQTLPAEQGKVARISIVLGIQ